MTSARRSPNSTSGGITPVEMRTESERDHLRVATVVAEAFGSPVEARLVEAIRASPESCLSCHW